MLATFDRKAIMQAAHATAKWRVATVGGSSREWFAKQLAFEWKKAKAARLRDESNIGLPLRSCPADAPAPRAVTSPRAARFGSARVFFGPGARKAAIDAYANRAGSHFDGACAAGRRAIEFA